MSKSPEELYQEREKRVNDAIALKVPDRVPIASLGGFLARRYTGISCKDMMYEGDKIVEAGIKMMEDLQMDLADNPFTLTYLGGQLDALGYRQLRWPGHGLDDKVSYQFIEDEYMKENEYDHFIEDPTDWIVRVYWPRICEELEPFKNMPPASDIISYCIGIPLGLIPFGGKEMEKAFNALVKAGQASQKCAFYTVKFNQEMAKRGFPAGLGGITEAPFDVLGDYFRGTRGILKDIHRRPEQLLKAIDKITPWMIRMGVAAGKASGNPRIFIPLHKGSDSFMSQKQFNTFFWPSLKQVIEGLVAEGMNPVVFLESNYLTRLEVMRDVPAGKCVYALEDTDIFKAKEILGDRVCLRGNVPIATLCFGTPDDVKDYCKKLIDVVGKDGGFIMDASATIEDAKIENVKAMINFTKEYGVY